MAEDHAGTTAMRPHRVRLDIVTRREGSASLTWAQRFIFDAISYLGQQVEHLHVNTRLPVTADVDITTALACLQTLFERHEGLRTEFGFDEQGEPFQRVMPSVTLDVDIDVLDEPVPAPSGAQSPDAGRHEPTSVTFARPEWPVRVALEVRDGVPEAFRLTLGHAIADAGGLRVLRDDFAQILAGRALPPVAQQPLDRAGFEAGPGGRNLAHRSLAYLRTQLTAAPQTLFPVVATAPADPRYWVGRLRSRAALLAAYGLSRRLKIPVSAVVLGVFATLLSARCRLERCTLLMFSGNRFTPGAQRYAGHLTQFTTISVDLAHDSVYATMRAASRNVLGGILNSQYPMADLDALVDDINVERGVSLDLKTTLNCQYMPAAVEATTGQPSAAQLRALQDTTTFAWRAKFAHENYKAFLEALVRDEHLLLDLRVDTSYLPPAHAERLVRGMEQLLVRLFGDDADLATAAAVTGMPSAQRSGLLVVDRSLVDPAACDTLVRDAVDPVAATVVMRPAGAGTFTPVAHIVPRDASDVSLPDLHLACVRALRGRLTAVAPAYYRVHAAPPREPAAPEAWDALPVLAEGTGRHSSQGPGRSAAGGGRDAPARPRSLPRPDAWRRPASDDGRQLT